MDVVPIVYPSPIDAPVLSIIYILTHAIANGLGSTALKSHTMRSRRDNIICDVWMTSLISGVIIELGTKDFLDRESVKHSFRTRSSVLILQVKLSFR